LKSKSVQHQEFVTVGYVSSMAASASVGSVLLGYQDKGKLIWPRWHGLVCELVQRNRCTRHGHCAPILSGLHPASQPSARLYRQELSRGVSWAEPGSYERSNTAVGLMMVWFVHRHSKAEGGQACGPNRPRGGG
jgi:hypothetical protein